MARIVTWEPEAEEQLNQNLHYYLTTYSSQAAENLYAEIRSKLMLAVRYPEAGQLMKQDETLRYFQVRRSHYLYYDYNDAEVVVVGLYGTKQASNPFK